MDLIIHTEGPIVIQLMDFFIYIQKVGTVSVQLVDFFIHTQKEPGRYTTDGYLYSHDRGDDRCTTDGLYFNKHTQSEWRVRFTTDGLFRPHRGNGRCASDGLSVSFTDTRTS